MAELLSPSQIAEIKNIDYQASVANPDGTHDLYIDGQYKATMETLPVRPQTFVANPTPIFNRLAYPATVSLALAQEAPRKTIQPVIEPPKTNRRVVNGSMLAAALVGIAPTVLSIPRTAEAASLVWQAVDDVKPFRYFPQGLGLREHWDAFLDIHQQWTGQDERARVYTAFLNPFEHQRLYAFDPSSGICNGGSARQATEPAPWAGESDFLDAIGGTLHYDDFPLNLGDGSSPRGFINNTRKNLAERRVPFVINRTPDPNQVWTNPVDRAQVTTTPQRDGRTRYDVILRAANYKESGGGYSNWRVSLLLNEANPNDLGAYLSSDIPIFNTYRPSYNMNEVLSRIDDPRWTSQEGQFDPAFRIKNNVMTKAMIKTYIGLAFPGLLG